MEHCKDQAITDDLEACVLRYTFLQQDIDQGDIKVPTLRERIKLLMSDLAKYNSMDLESNQRRHEIVSDKIFLLFIKYELMNDEFKIKTY